MMSYLPTASVAVILPAAGSSRRFGGNRSKLFASLGGMPLWWHSAKRLRQRVEVGPIIMAISPGDRDHWESEFSELLAQLQIRLVDGGKERCDSVLGALHQMESSPQNVTRVAVHDAARPLVSEQELDRLFAAAAEHPAVILACPIHGTIKRTDSGGQVETTVKRDNLWEAQTPQVFERSLLLDAYRRWRGWPITDDASVVERAGYGVRVVAGSPLNLKITTIDDLCLAEAILQAKGSDMG